MPIRNRISEADIAVAIVHYLQENGGSATISQIRHHLPSYVALNDNDLQPSASRPGELLWEQQVRNIVSHREDHQNFVKRGILKYSPRRLSLG